jgi:hypothetical protein
MKAMSRVLVLALLAALSAAGCATTQARTPERPPLEVPPVPPRSIEPALPAEQLPIDPLASQDPPVPPRGLAPVAQPTRPARSDPPKPDPARTEPPPETAPPPAPPLRLPQTVDEGAAEREIRGILERADKALAAINPARLNANAREQYDTVTRIRLQAEDAIKARNFVYARTLAERAETIAKQLAGSVK